MKKVAATSGQSVNLAMDFLAVGNAREGYWAGSDKELNLYSRPPQRSSLARCGEASSQSQNTRVLSACKRKMSPNENIFSNSLSGLSYWSADVFPRRGLAPLRFVRLQPMLDCSFAFAVDFAREVLE
jgi:hypothetical protein